MKLKPWKYLVAIWMTAVVIASFLISIPDIPILKQSARNLFLHVPMWFTMAVCFVTGLVYSIKYLNAPSPELDRKAETATQIGLLFGVCGLLTGSVWARFTWGTWWTFAEPRMNLSALGMMIYVAYFVLRTAFDDPEKRAKIAAVYNVFAATTIPFLLYIIPRQLPSLHPGAEGNPAFSDITAPEMRYVFYPAVIGFIALAIWLIDILNRYKKVRHKIEQQRA
ncbi:MAG: cytochrome c biogenesis protein CcsA [Balneolaceae bacterium]|jgi:heme exporter protein C